MSRLMPTLSTLVLLSVASQLAPAAQVNRMKNHGEDGSVAYHSVYCSNGSVGSVAVHRSPPKTCAAPANGQTQCRTGWNLRAAAKFACR